MNQGVQKNQQFVERRSVERDNQWGKRNSTGVVIASSMSFENISYNTGGTDILKDISLNVEPGEVLCLLGPSGSGKTTLLRIAAGLIEDATGSIKIDGRTIADHKTFIQPDKRGVGLVFQDYALFPHLTILQNVEFGLTALSKSEAKTQAMRILSRVGLDDRASQYPHVLSGGEQQRVALARALAPRPGILLMDEPFSGLDSRLRDSIREQTIDLLRETRSTAIIVTHDAEEALRVGDHVALIQDGKLVQYGEAKDLYYRPANLFAAGFFSEINVIPSNASNGIATTVFGDCPCDDALSAACCAAIRLTDIDVKPYDAALEGVMGRVSLRRFIGTSELLEINIENLDEPISVRIKAGELPDNARLVTLNVDPKSMMIFANS
jgi:iron(III) transport system ATP-binding protein